MISPNRSCRLKFLIFLVLVTAGPVLSQSNFLESEREIFRHDEQLNQVAEALENWLSGRMPQAELLETLKGARKQGGPYRTLPKAVGTKLYGWESRLLQSIEQFASQKAPDAKGQKKLFLLLGSLTESRSTELLQWRKSTLAGLLAKKPDAAQRAYFEWELKWIEIWRRETLLTSQLEQAFLDENSTQDPREILKSFLQLTAQADQISVPANLAAVNTTSRERLTLLTRTAEQLVRLDTRQSSSALTRVRRLSRQLSKLTSQFQADRLTRLEKLL